MTSVLDSLVPDYLKGTNPVEQNIAGGGGGFGSMINALKDLPEAIGQGVGQVASAVNPINLAGQAAGAVTGTNPITGEKMSPLDRVISGAMAGGALYGLGKAGLAGYQSIRTHYPDLFGPFDEYGALYPRDVFRSRTSAAWPDAQMDPGSPLAQLGGQPAPGPEGAMATGHQFPYDEGLLGPYKSLTPDDFLNSRTGDLLRARSVTGVGTAMVMESPEQIGLFRTLADDYAQLPAHAGSHPVTALGWELNKWESGAQKGILPKDDVDLWKKVQYGTANADELTQLQQRMIQFAKDTSWINDPHLGVHPLLEFTKVQPQPDGSNLLVLKHRNFTNNIDLSEKSGDPQTVRQDRLRRLDYTALSPVISDNVKRVMSFANDDERTAATGWYQKVHSLFHDDPKGLINEIGAAGEDDQPVPGLTKQQALATAQWRQQHPEIPGELLSSVTAAVSGQKPWGGDVPISNPELATKTIDALLSKAHGSIDEYRNMDWHALTESEYRGGIFNPQKMNGLSRTEFEKSARLLGGDDFLDVMFAGDPKAVTLKTRNFSVNIAQPEAWFPITVDRHAYALAVGFDPSVEKPPVGEGQKAYNAIANSYRSVALDEGMLPNEVQALTWTVWKRLKDEYSAAMKTGIPVHLPDGGTITPSPGKLFTVDDRILRLIQGEGDLAPHEVGASIPTGDMLVPAKSLSARTIPGNTPKQLTIVANPNTGEQLVAAPPTADNLRGLGPAYPTPYMDARPFPDGKPRPWSNLWGHRFAAPVDDVNAEAERIHANPAAGSVGDFSPLLGLPPGRYDQIKNLIDTVKQPGDGATINPRTLEQPTEGYAAVTKPQLGMKISPELLTPDVVNQWLEAVGSELGKNGMHIGTFHSPDSGQVYLDASKVFPEDQRAAAIKAGKAGNQESIAHLSAIAKGDWDHAFINTGGTGDVEGMFHPSPARKNDLSSLIDYLHRVDFHVPATELRSQEAQTLPSMQGRHAIVVNGLADLSQGLDSGLQGSSLAVHNSLLRTLKQRDLQPLDSAVLDPHHSDSPFGSTSRQSLVMYYDKAADLQKAWDVVTEFEPRYNEPILDRRAYVFGTNETPSNTRQVFEHHYQGPDGSTLSHLTERGSSMDPHTVQTWVQNEFAGSFKGQHDRPNTIDRGQDGQTAVYNGSVRIVDRGRGTSVRLKSSSLLDTTRNGEKVKEISIWVPPTGDIPVMSFSGPELLVKRNPAATPDRIFHGTVSGNSVKLDVPAMPGATGEGVFNLSMFERARLALTRAGVSEVVPNA